MKKENGAVAVELAIVFPILAVVLFAITEFGITLVHEEQWVSAARDGARYAAVSCGKAATGGCSAGDITTRVANSAGCADTSCLTPGSPATYVGGSAVAANWCSSDPSHVGDLVTVKWQQDVHVISIPFFGNIPVSPTISSSFRCE
jgi:Flp pilus assembly protein TadG